MMRTLPKKMSELGRIRIGDQAPNSNGRGKHPRKLENFRLTSNNKPLLHLAANLYGGEVQAWEDAPTPDQWQLYTTSNSLDVLLPTFSAINVSYELWSGGGCLRRCTGEMVTHCPLEPAKENQPCTCPLDEQERHTLATEGKACARILRLNVILPDLPGTGAWRLETKGFYATAELLGTLAMLHEAGAANMMIEALLRLEQRSVKRLLAGKSTPTTMRFAVPTLWPKYTFRQIAAAGQARGLLMHGSPLDASQKSLPQNVGDLYGDEAQDILEKSMRMAQVETSPALEGGNTPEANLGHPEAKHRQSMDPTQFSYRLEQIWTRGGLTKEEQSARYVDLMKPYKSGRIPESRYEEILVWEQTQVHKRRQGSLPTQTQEASFDFVASAAIDREDNPEDAE